jgi:hypothetical protein
MDQDQFENMKLDLSPFPSRFVSPVSFGLYLLGFLLPLIGMLPGLVGLVLTMFHGAPGYELSILFGFQERGVVVNGTRYIWLDGIFWGVIYGLIGFIFDKKLWQYSLTAKDLTRRWSRS